MWFRNSPGTIHTIQNTPYYHFNTTFYPLWVTGEAQTNPRWMETRGTAKSKETDSNTPTGNLIAAHYTDMLLVTCYIITKSKKTFIHQNQGCIWILKKILLTLQNLVSIFCCYCTTSMRTYNHSRFVCRGEHGIKNLWCWVTDTQYIAAITQTTQHIPELPQTAQTHKPVCFNQQNIWTKSKN